MSKDNHVLGDVEYAGKVKAQIFKEFQLERFIREGIVISASKLAEAKEQELQPVRGFKAVQIDEERHRKTATVAPGHKLDKLPLT